jgi:selenide,water dikinase
MRDVPLLANVESMAASGVVTGASARNWDAYGSDVDLGPAITSAQKALLTDPQTSGGLLVSCAQHKADAVLGIFKREGFARAQVIGSMRQGPVRTTVT